MGLYRGWNTLLVRKVPSFFEFPSCLTFLVSGTRLRPVLFHPWPAQGFSPSRTHFERRRDWSPRMQVRYEASLFQAQPSDPVFTRVAVRHSRGPCHALIFHFCDSSVARDWNGPAQTKLADHVTNGAPLLSVELMRTTEYVWRVRPMRFPQDSIHVLSFFRLFFFLVFADLFTEGVSPGSFSCAWLKCSRRFQLALVIWVVLVWQKQILVKLVRSTH